MAMGEWVDTSQAETTLSNILPRIDQRTANQTLTQSKQVVNDIVNIVKQFIYTIADTNLSSQANNPRYYNQSGPSMPPLYYPYDGQLQVRQCTSFEVSMANASLTRQTFWDGGSSYCSSRRCSKPRMIMSKDTAIILGLLCLTEPALALGLVCSR